jgi:hypothetical protein
MRAQTRVPHQKRREHAINTPNRPADTRSRCHRASCIQRSTCQLRSQPYASTCPRATRPCGHRCRWCRDRRRRRPGPIRSCTGSASCSPSAPSNRPGLVGAHLDIYRASFDGIGVSDVTLASELASGANEFSPVVSADGLTIFFSSDRTDGGAKGGTDIWTARRPSLTAPFSDVKTVPELNTTADEEAGWLSPDGCRLYSFSSIAGSHLYVASRP